MDNDFVRNVKQSYDIRSDNARAQARRLIHNRTIMKMSGLDWLAVILVIVGGINWGLVGVFDWNLVEAILGGVPVIERIVYILVGLGALYELGRLGKRT